MNLKEVEEALRQSIDRGLARGLPNGKFCLTEKGRKYVEKMGTIPVAKDGRKLSEYQGYNWMRSIGEKRKYLNQAKGEQNGNAKLTAGQVLSIRHSKICTREHAKWLGKKYGISPRYVYHIRARRKWKHI
jgi:hypothetical protein